MLCEFSKKASRIDKTVAQNNMFVEDCILFVILHFCVGKPNCKQASMPSGLLVRLTTLIKNEHGSLTLGTLKKVNDKCI